MNNIKVEINGLDTSKLERVSGEKQMEMLKKIKNGQEEYKEEFIYANLRLVLSIIKKFNNRGENINDIFQVGVIGLIKAIDNFSMEHNVQFSTYAVPMIIGEIKRFLRDNSAFRVARSIRDLAYQISQLREEYLNTYNEEPTVDKICELTKQDKDEVILAIDSMTTPMSIYDTVYSDGGDNIYLLDQLKSEQDESLMITNKIAVEQILENLSDKERYIIERRYFKDKTQMEIAQELEVSQAQVSRIEKTAINRIKRKIGKIE